MFGNIYSIMLEHTVQTLQEVKDYVLQVLHGILNMLYIRQKQAACVSFVIMHRSSRCIGS